MTATRRQLVLGAGAGLLLPGLARAQAPGWQPARPILVIVPYAPGNTGDVVLRLVAEGMEARLGQRIVIDARPGAGGNIGAAAVARAEADGHTLLLGATNNFVMNQFLFRDMGFDPLTAFAPIIRLADVPSVLYSHPSVPARTLGEFIDHARRNPGKLNYGSPSAGTAPHLAVERLMQLTGIEMVHVPYRGSPQVIAALLAGDVQFFVGGLSAGKAAAEAGRLRMLAVATEARLPALPEVPTAIEAGVPGYTAANWWGLAAPRGTPAAAIAALHAAARDAVRAPAVTQRLSAIGITPGADATPEGFAASLREEAAIWSETIRRGHISVE